ncbi:uncharacterized protein LOC144431214 [Styela clava]
MKTLLAVFAIFVCGCYGGDLTECESFDTIRECKVLGIENAKECASHECKWCGKNQSDKSPKELSCIEKTKYTTCKCATAVQCQSTIGHDCKKENCKWCPESDKCIMTDSGEKLSQYYWGETWPYCGSSLAVTAAFLTGVDISAKIEDMVMSVTQKKSDVNISKWANGWVAFSKSVIPTVISFLSDLNLSSGSSGECDVAGIVEQKPKSDFDLLFDPVPKKALKYDGPINNNNLENEVNLFQKLRQPNSHPMDYWKNEHKFPLLKAGAKIVLAVPVSSASVERLFSAAGLFLTKLRQRMLPSLVINSVYIKYASKMKINEKVQVSKLAELLVDEQEINDLLNDEESDLERPDL